jgi:type II secretory pathway pseudopilin PulG
LTGRGRAVITSSTALEYSFELDTGHVTGKAAPSVFTEALVEGLRTGRADRDRDGLVSVDDLYGYVYERVREVTPHQTPEKKWGEISGDFIVAKNPNPPATSGVPLPGRLIDELRSTDSNLRERAFRELTRLAFGDNEGVAITARETLQVLADDESPVISSAAMAALTESQLAQSAPSRPGRRRRLSLGLIGVSAVSVVLAVVGMALAGVLPNLRHVGDTSGRVPQAGSAMAAGLSALRHYRDVAIQAQERRRIARTTPTVSPSPPPPTVPIASATASIVYEPWTASGRSLVTGIHVLSTQSGADCVGGAESSYRADAYRCFTDGGNIYDPCFADPSFFPVHPQLACPLKAADEVVLIHSAKELPRQSPVDTTRVWMIILSNGETCTFAGGATEEVAGMRLNYDCSDGAYLYGDPVNENGAFSIYRQGPGNPALAKVHVATAYL